MSRWKFLRKAPRSPRLRRTDLKATPYVLGEAVLPLHAFTFEKDDGRTRIQNLQQACRSLNGTIVPSGVIFSFWRQIGRPSRRLGYRLAEEFGREGKERGGGLGRVASALAQAADAAGLMTLERHMADGYSTFVRFGEADLRFAAPEVVSGGPSVAIEARLTPSELVVRIRGSKPKMLVLSPRVEAPTNVIQTVDAPARHLLTAALLDRRVPEFEAYLSGELLDYVLLPSPITRRPWHLSADARHKYAWRQVPTQLWKQLLRARHRSSAPARYDLESWQRAERLAAEYARRLPNNVEHLIVLQDFLPFLWMAGVLEGRSFDVLLTRPPLHLLQEKMSGTGEGGFRAPLDFVRAESEALFFAERAITPHAAYAELYPHLRKLEWQRPQMEPPPGVRRPKYLLFPASLTQQQGASSALAAARAVGLPLLVTGHDSEGLGHDEAYFLKASRIPWHEVAAVVHPTALEAWPRLHLKALSLGLPVIATEACGLEEGDGVSLVAFNDEADLQRALIRALHRDGDRSIEPPSRPKLARVPEKVSRSADH